MSDIKQKAREMFNEIDVYENLNARPEEWHLYEELEPKIFSLLDTIIDLTIAEARNTILKEIEEEVDFELKRFEDKATIVNFAGKEAWQEYKNGLKFVKSLIHQKLIK